MFQRFLSRYDFDQLASSTALATPSRPEIIKWRLLEIGAVFRVIDRVTIPSTDGDKMYTVLETESREIIHVWITSIINEELKNMISLKAMFLLSLWGKEPRTLPAKTISILPLL